MFSDHALIPVYTQIMLEFLSNLRLCFLCLSWHYALIPGCSQIMLYFLSVLRLCWSWVRKDGSWRIDSFWILRSRASSDNPCLWRTFLTSSTDSASSKPANRSFSIFFSRIFFGLSIFFEIFLGKKFSLDLFYPFRFFFRVQSFGRISLNSYVKMSCVNYGVHLHGPQCWFMHGPTSLPSFPTSNEKCHYIFLLFYSVTLRLAERSLHIVGKGFWLRV